MIKIGVSACLMHPDLNRSYFGPKLLNYLENDMARYLNRSDVLIVLIPYFDGNDELLSFLTQFDGFVFQGGSDISPKSYGEEGIQDNKWPGDKVRDDYELKIMDYAFKNKIPVYGICRGHQLINTYFGGTLYQDIASQYEAQYEHRNAKEYDKISHEVKLLPNEYLSMLYQGNLSGEISTVHHQAVKVLGKGLVETAISTDGLNEGFRYKDMEKFYCLAVQWHPEFHHDKPNLLDANILYDDFIQNVKKRKK